MTVRRFAGYRGGFGGLSTATPADVERFLVSLEVSPQSRAYYASDLAAFYRWAVRMGHTTTNPLEGRENERRPRGVPRPIATGDLTMAIQLAPPRTRTMLVLMAFAGLRASEVAELEASDIDRERGVLVVRGKGNKDRVIDMHPMVEGVLRDVKRGPVIRAAIAPYGPITPDTVSRVVSEYLRGLGINKTGHKLRHWFATETMDECGNIRVVQELLGHASPATTAVYTLVRREQSRAAVLGLSLTTDEEVPT